MAKCPLRVCRAEFEHVTQQVWPEGDWPAGTPRPIVASIPLHNLVAEGAPTMACPASLMVLPLGAYKESVLREQADNIERLLERRNSPVIGAGTKDREAEPHGRTPNPDEAPYWFRDHGTGPTPEGLPQGPTGYPRMQLGELGEALASVAEVRQTLLAVEAMIEDGRASVMAGEARLTDALGLINICRETSVDPMGAPQLAVAIEKLNEASAGMLLAAQESERYRTSL